MSKRIMRTRKSGTAHKNGFNCNTVGQTPSARLLEDARRQAPAPKWLKDAWDLAEQRAGRK